MNLDPKSISIFDYWSVLSESEDGLAKAAEALCMNLDSITAETLNAKLEKKLFEFMDDWSIIETDTLTDEGLSKKLSLVDFFDDPISYSFNQSLFNKSKGIFGIKKEDENWQQLRSLILEQFMTKWDKIDEWFIAKMIPKTSTGKAYLESLKKALLQGPLFALYRLKGITFLSSLRSRSVRVHNMKDGSDLGHIVHEILRQNSLKSKPAYDFLTQQLKVFGIADEIIIKKDEEGYQFKLYIVQDGNESILADEGYGISQVLPILLNITKIAANQYEFVDVTNIEELISSNPYVMVIEEPEANLHPALQSKLANLFYEAYKRFNIQFVIETHSEYLIRKLQYLTAKGEIKPCSTQIYYFYHPDEKPDGEPQVKAINIDENGMLSHDFGTGFFDEADRIAMSIWNMNNAQKN